MTDSLVFPVPSIIQTERLLIQPFSGENAVALHHALEESIEELRQYLWFIPWIAEEPTLKSAQIRCQKAAENFRLRADGYAVEAVGELVSWALQKLQAKRIELVTDEENAGSRRVAEKCGFFWKVYYAMMLFRLMARFVIIVCKQSYRVKSNP